MRMGLFAILLGVSIGAIAKGVKIDYFGFYVGDDAPPGAMVKLKKAAALASLSKNCAEVTGGAWLPVADQDPEHPGKSYYVTCSAKHGFAYNIYYDEADLKSEKIKEQEQPIATDLALAMCKKATTERLRFPSSADFNWIPVEAGAGGTPNQRIVLDFSALNGFGNKIPQRGICIITPKGHTDVTVQNR